MTSTTEPETDWTSEWAAAIVAEPYSSENVESRLQDLLDGKTVFGVIGGAKDGKAKYLLEGFAQNTDWTFKGSAFDDIWRAVFKVAKKLGCTESVRDATYFWTETYLLNEAWDVYPKEEVDKDHPIYGGDYDNSWITASLGEARLFALATLVWAGGGNSDTDQKILQGQPCPKKNRCAYARRQGKGLRSERKPWQKCIRASTAL